MSLVLRRRQLVSDLTAAVAAAPLTVAVTVTGDPRTVQPPCVLVAQPAGLERAACGLAGVVPVVLIAAGPGNADALELLLDLLEVIVPALDVAGPAHPTTYYTDATGDTGLAAYTVDAHLTT